MIDPLKCLFNQKKKRKTSKKESLSSGFLESRVQERSLGEIIVK